MISDELIYQIHSQFGFTPTAEQEEALHTFASFMTDRDPHAVMILRGSAGTGKTSLAGAIVRTLTSLNQKVMLLAPTGRAAKALSTVGIPLSPFTARFTVSAYFRATEDSSI
jgi:RecG-like helicase